MQVLLAAITNHCSDVTAASALCKALCHAASFSSSSRQRLACTEGQRRDVSSACAFEKEFIYSRRMVIAIFFYSTADLCRTCSL